MGKRILTMSDVEAEAKRVADSLAFGDAPFPLLYGIPRGGIPAALAVALHCQRATVVDDPTVATAFIDDIWDSGATANRYMNAYPGIPFFALFDKRDRRWADQWLVMPWEQSDTDSSADDIVIRLLQHIGEDPTRGGLLETPKRVIKAWEEYTSGYAKDPAQLLKCFEDGAENYDQMVIVRDIPFVAHCEHHLAPFFGTATVAYIPRDRVVGLSKLNRLVDMFARRLTIQERMTGQIADALMDNLNPIGVGVIVSARHTCVEMRGIKQQGSSTVTSALRGVLLTEASARAEFFGLAS